MSYAQHPYDDWDNQEVSLLGGGGGTYNEGFEQCLIVCEL